MEMLSALLAMCEGNPWVTAEFPSQRSVMGSFDDFFVVEQAVEQTVKKAVICDALWFHCDDIILGMQ